MKVEMLTRIHCVLLHAIPCWISTSFRLTQRGRTTARNFVLPLYHWKWKNLLFMKHCNFIEIYTMDKVQESTFTEYQSFIYH
jgi:hypothetical protein